MKGKNIYPSSTPQQRLNAARAANAARKAANANKKAAAANKNAAKSLMRLARG